MNQYKIFSKIWFLKISAKQISIFNQISSQFDESYSRSTFTQFYIIKLTTLFSSSKDSQYPNFSMPANILSYWLRWAHKKENKDRSH